MGSLTEEFRKREAVKPDQWTLAWWRNQFAEQAKATRGAIHSMNCVSADNADLHGRIQELENDLGSQQQQIQEAEAAIGQLQAEVTELKETMEKAREAYAKLNSKVSQVG